MDSGHLRNLVKNPCGNDQFNHWEIIENGGSMWRVEEMPGDCGYDFPDSSILTYFVTSFEICLKEQTIDLVSEGYTEEILDSVQPKIEVQDWFSGRKDCGCNYELHVSLLNGNLEPVNEFKAEPVNLDPDNEDCIWRKNAKQMGIQTDDDQQDTRAAEHFNLGPVCSQEGQSCF
ncbi:F-box only protein 2 isoform X2 [Polypterus senegalus]|uniref:F-box only protein 2 isoform X2 n=1 Tax=Polypterus senegalus TaxID=55291 RepID=UPI0019655FB4|nr:F-box only protein 2 isoform X2 [Polypterus senegalus]